MEIIHCSDALALVVEERAKQHDVLADKLAAHLTVNGKMAAVVPMTSSRQVETLVDERVPELRLCELVLPDVVRGEA